MLLAGGDLPATMARDVTFHRRQRRSFQQVPLHRLAPQAKAQSTTNIYSLALRCAARTGRRKAGWHETNLHVWVATILPLHFLGFEFPGRCLKVIYNPTAPGVGFWPAKQKIVGGRTPEPKWIDREKSAIKTAALLSQKSFSLLWTCLSHLLQAFIRHYTIFCKPTNKLTTATLVFLWAKKGKLSRTCWLPHHHRRFHLTIQCTWNFHSYLFLCLQLLPAQAATDCNARVERRLDWTLAILSVEMSWTVQKQLRFQRLPAFILRLTTVRSNTFPLVWSL